MAVASFANINIRHEDQANRILFKHFWAYVNEQASLRRVCD